MIKKITISALLIAVIVSAAFVFNGKDNNAFSNISTGTVPLKRTCGTTEYMENLYKQDPEYKLAMQRLEKFAEQYAKDHPAGTESRTVITIPVVVHVVWNTPQQNISDDQIASQIDALNKDFRRLNADTVNTPAPWKSLGADCQIEFKMARRDPNNNPTLGITRTQTSITEFGQSTALKYTASGGHDGWDRDKYLNLWVCNLGSDLLGYATFPGGSAALDGVAIGYTFFGTMGTATPPYNKGRTATHEVGHWLWLYHIWGDDGGSCIGSDAVGDTPNQALEFYGCPAYPQVDACTSVAPGVMFMNYMDYTDDGCMNLFTQGQLVRVNAALTGPRLPIQSSNGHVDVSGTPICSFKADTISIEYNNPLHFSDLSAGIPTGWQWTFTGANPPTSNAQNPTVVYPTPGIYTVKLRVSNSFGADSLIKTSYIRVRGAMLSGYSVVSPVTLTRLNVASNDTSRVSFNWTRASNNNTVNYKVKFRKLGQQIDYTFTSATNAADSVLSIRKSALDSLAQVLGVTGDSVRCSWRAWAFNGIDSLSSQNSNLITLVRSTIGIQTISSEIPQRFALYNNYPNPFNPVTKIRFDIPNLTGNKNVSLVIYDILGNEVSVLVNQEMTAGKYEASWEASNFASGIYFYRIKAGDFVQTHRMILVK
jgi:PKD repeat protein